MEGNGSRKLSWIAIALGGLALFVALSGRMQSHGDRFRGPLNYSQPPAFQAGPQGQFDPRGPVDPQGQFDPKGQFGPRHGFGQAAPAGPWNQAGPRNGFDGPMHWGGPSHGFRFFFLPFMLIGGLMKLAFVALLIWLGLRLIRGGGRGPWGRGPGGPTDQDPPSRPGPEQPPYTGDTQQM